MTVSAFDKKYELKKKLNATKKTNMLNIENNISKFLLLIRF